MMVDVVDRKFLALHCAGQNLVPGRWMTRTRADARQCSPVVVVTGTDTFSSYFLFGAGDMVVVVVVVQW